MTREQRFARERIDCPKCRKVIRPTPYCPFCGADTAKKVEVEEKSIPKTYRSDAEAHDRVAHVAREGRLRIGEAFALVAEFADESLPRLANHATHGDFDAAKELAKRILNDAANGGPIAQFAKIIVTEEADPAKAAEILRERLRQKKKQETEGS